MAEENGRVVERVLKTRQPDKAFPTWDEIMVIEALGERYLKALDDPGMLDIALSDYKCDPTSRTAISHIWSERLISMRTRRRGCEE